MDSIIRVDKTWGQTHLDKIETSKINKNYWQKMINSIDIKAFYMLPHILGCPDCLDGGAEWLTIGTKDNEWNVEFDYGSDTVSTKKLLSIINQIK
jgi:hypothetical protein